MPFEVVRMMKKERNIWSGVWVSFGWSNIEKICSGMKSFGPEFGRHGGVNEKSTDDAIKRT
jgi:hypothetical protein